MSLTPILVQCEGIEVDEREGQVEQESPIVGADSHSAILCIVDVDLHLVHSGRYVWVVDVHMS